MRFHEPRCPSADAPDRDAAHSVATCTEQGWCANCTVWTGGSA
ncbi:DUF5999 family protein [Streptomyces bacillaris]